MHGRHVGDRRVADLFDGVNLAMASHLIAGGYLLHGPAVAVRIAEEDKPDVVQVLPVSGRARTRSADHLYLADLHPDRADYGSYLSFKDPDGNGWLIQEVKNPVR